MGQEPIKVQKLLKNTFSDGFPDGSVGTNAKQVGRHIDRDSNISMFMSDGSECQGDPFSFQKFEPKNHNSELRRFREVERSRPWFV